MSALEHVVEVYVLPPSYTNAWRCTCGAAASGYQARAYAQAAADGHIAAVTA